MTVTQPPQLLLNRAGIGVRRSLVLSLFAGTFEQMPAGLDMRLGAYRHSVFVEELGWQLACQEGDERDQFDRPDTVYVVAQDDAGELCGCARLLPTTQGYLLGDVFPELMNGVSPPHSPDLWELSRFSTRPSTPGKALSRDEQRERFCALFRALTGAALQRGAARLITFTALGVERILRQIGIHAHRIGPPQWIDGQPVIAMYIELDELTAKALEP